MTDNAMALVSTVEPNLELKTLIKDTIREVMTEFFPDLVERVDVLEENITEIKGRLISTETKLETAASKSEVERLATAHAARDRQLTTQVAELANVQADNNAKFKDIKDKVSEIDGLKTTINTLSSAVDTMSTNLNTYMESGRDTLKAQAQKLEKHDEQFNTLRESIKFTDDRVTDTEKRYIETYVPMHDYIMGSKTQKPMKDVIGGLESSLSSQNLQLVGQGQQLKTIADYVAAQQKKEDEERNYWKRFRRNMATPQGALRALSVIIIIIIFAQAFSLDQFFARLQQLRLALGH